MIEGGEATECLATECTGDWVPKTQQNVYTNTVFAPDLKQMDIHLSMLVKGIENQQEINIKDMSGQSIHSLVFHIQGNHLNRKKYAPRLRM